MEVLTFRLLPIPASACTSLAATKLAHMHRFTGTPSTPKS